LFGGAANESETQRENAILVTNTNFFVRKVVKNAPLNAKGGTLGAISAN
jgi:hypothetical protein